MIREKPLNARYKTLKIKQIFPSHILQLASDSRILTAYQGFEEENMIFLLSTSSKYTHQARKP